MFTVGPRGSQGNFKVVQVTPEYIVFTEQRDQQKWERVVPIDRITFEVRQTR